MVAEVVPGQVLPCKSSGRLMEVLNVNGKLLWLRPARGDREHTTWVRRDACVIWPTDWVWMPGEQMAFCFAIKDNDNRGRKAEEVES